MPRPLRYSINVTLDGCCDHRAGVPDEEMHRNAEEGIERADALVSSTLGHVDWNSELLEGDIGEAVQKLKDEPGKGLATGGVQLPLALAELGLIDEYEFVVHPRLAGHGPTPSAGLSKFVDLKLVDQREFESGAVALRYEARAS